MTPLSMNPRQICCSSRTMPSSSASSAPKFMVRCTAHVVPAQPKHPVGGLRPLTCARVDSRAHVRGRRQAIGWLCDLCAPYRYLTGQEAYRNRSLPIEWQRGSRPAPNLLHGCLKSAVMGQESTKLRLNIRPSPTKVGPESSSTGPDSGKFDPSNRPNPTPDVGHTMEPKFCQDRPKAVQKRPNSPGISQTWPEFG